MAQRHENDSDSRPGLTELSVGKKRLIRLDPDRLEEVETPEYPIRHVLNESDFVTIQHRAGNVTTGPITDVKRVGFKIDPRNRTASGYFSYGDLARYKDAERGVVNTLLDINGEPADRIISRRQEHK